VARSPDHIPSWALVGLRKRALTLTNLTRGFWPELLAWALNTSAAPVIVGFAVIAAVVRLACPLQTFATFVALFSRSQERAERALTVLRILSGKKPD
jgi:hypothetical protein